MSENYVSKVIKVAEAEVGYLEKASNKYLDDKTKNAGSANYTKYGRDMHKIYPSVMDFPAAWCDCFVDYCFQKAYGVANAKGLLGGNFDDYTVASAQLYKNKNAWYTSSPKIGDQIFFKNSGGICHTGLVYDVDSKYVYTIEGNTSGANGVVANGGGVCKKKYTLNNKSIAGYGRPKYDIETKDEPKKETAKVEPKKTTDVKIQTASHFSRAVAGTYVITASELNLRSGAGTKYPVIATVSKNKKVECYGYYNVVSKDSWLYVTYNGKVGYMSKKYLKKK